MRYPGRDPFTTRAPFPWGMLVMIVVIALLAMCTSGCAATAEPSHWMDMLVIIGMVAAAGSCFWAINYADTGARVLAALTMVALAFLLMGCQTRPEPAPLRSHTPCPPLPACTIPTRATPKQLSEALYTCVLEYRALYSVCMFMNRHEESPE